MRINHNIAALNTHRQLSSATGAQSKSMEKLSSGLRINRAGDDAAGLAISEKMRGQIRGLDMAAKNAQDGISMIQTAEGALNETHAILQRMRELATQAANDTYTDTDRGEIQKEINQLTSEINRIGNTTEFNTKKLLDGGASIDNTTQPTTGTATEAKKTADAALANDIALNTATKIVINGKDVTLTNVSALGANFDGEADGANLASALQDDIDAVADLKDKFKVTFDTTTKKLSIETVDKGETAKVDLTGSDVGTATLLGFTTLDEVKGTTAKTDDAGAGAGFSATFQIGANAGQSMTIDILDMRATSGALKIASENETEVKSNSEKTAKYTEALVVTNGTDNVSKFKALDVSNHANASAAIDVINDAIINVSAERSKLGAFQNRLEHTINNLGTSAENLTAAESRIRDVDMAKEMMDQTKASILAQASQAMLAQANQMPQGVLQLLR